MPFGLFEHYLDAENDEPDDEPVRENFWELVECIAEYHNCKLVKMSLNTFFKSVQCWSYNRPLDLERVATMKTAFLQDHGFLPSIFTLVECGNEIWLVDGQHRQRALDEITNENPDFEYELVALVHQAQSEQEIKDIFCTVNDTKPLSPQDIPNDLLIQIMEQLCEQFPKGIKKTAGQVYYPNINYADLKKRISPLITSTTDPAEFVLRIRKINRKYGKMPQVPNLKKKIGKTALQKATDNKFWLGLDTEWSWMDQL